jgi:hypothetical protein
MKVQFVWLGLMAMAGTIAIGCTNFRDHGASLPGDGGAVSADAAMDASPGSAVDSGVRGTGGLEGTSNGVDSGRAAGAAGTGGGGGNGGAGFIAGAGSGGQGGNGGNGWMMVGASTGGATLASNGGAGPLPCTGTQRLCNGLCVASSSLDACGPSCLKCTPPAGGTATCDGTSCDFSCGAMKKCPAAGICVPAAGCCSNADCPTMPGGQAGSCDSASHMCDYSCPAMMQACTVGATVTCIPAGACCKNSDCTGTCKLCSAAHACVAAVGIDDPNGRCSGTCDATGACKSKRGQLCTTVPGAGCVSGSTCSPDGYCCNTACSGACEACDVTGSLGTCLPIGGATHGGHPSCGGSGSCAGTCTGTVATCTFPGAETSCLAGTCTSGKATRPAVCDGVGKCQTPSVVACAPFTCGPKDCLGTCGSNSDCVTGAACTSGTCSVCPATRSVCPNACADLSSDGSNCGTCGHDCQGGACVGSVCQPKLVAGGFVAGPLAVGPDSIYVVDYGSGGRLIRIAKANGVITPIATGSIWDVAVFGTSIYWTTSMTATDGKVTRAALDGSSPTDIATGQAGARAIVADADGVFWLSGNGATDGVVMRLGPTDATPFQFAAMQATLDALGVDATNVYWMTNGTIGDGSDGAVFSKTKKGGPIVTIATMQHDATGSGISVTASGGRVFWDPRGLGNTDGAVRSASGAGGGAITEFAANQVRPQGIAADATFVYWIDAGNGTDGLLQRASLATKAVTQLAGGLANPGDLGLDGPVLYFGTQGNSSPLIAGGLYRLVP